MKGGEKKYPRDVEQEIMRKKQLKITNNKNNNNK